MPHDLAFAAPDAEYMPDLVVRLTAQYAPLSTKEAISRAVQDARLGRLALVSSFGAESVVLLHMISQTAPALPVLFLDTQLLFAQTLRYQTGLSRALGLTGVRVLRTSKADLARHDPQDDLHKKSPDACCELRKTKPLERALAGFDSWITGRKRYQGGARRNMGLFEHDPNGRLKFNPLARWSTGDIQTYITTHSLARHPLVAQGFHSIGCAPCTGPDIGRAGRWPGNEKTECGIHLPAKNAVIVLRDTGFGPEDWTGKFATPETLNESAAAPLALDLAGETSAEMVGKIAHGPEQREMAPSGMAQSGMNRLGMIRVTFSSFADGRGFSLARQLRRAGFRGRLRARGPLLPDQYAMLRRVGYDEIELAHAQTLRHPESDWLARTDWRAHDYQARLMGWT